MCRKYSYYSDYYSGLRTIKDSKIENFQSMSTVYCDTWRCMNETTTGHTHTERFSRMKVTFRRPITMFPLCNIHILLNLRSQRDCGSCRRAVVPSCRSRLWYFLSPLDGASVREAHCAQASLLLNLRSPRDCGSRRRAVVPSCRRAVVPFAPVVLP